MPLSCTKPCTNKVPMHAFSRTVLPAYYLSPNMKTNSSNTLLYTSNSFNLRWRNICNLPVSGSSFCYFSLSYCRPWPAWASLATGLPISRPTGPSIKTASRLPARPSCLKITRIQKYLLYKTLFYVEQPPSAYHIPPLKKSCENYACDFFFSEMTWK